jgi:hypothetical protein
MSAKTLFAPDGDKYVPTNQRIADSDLPRAEKAAAKAVWEAIVDEWRDGDPELWITDWRLSKNRWLRGFSERYVQKGLLALQKIGLVDRCRRRGRRGIRLLTKLKGSNGRSRGGGAARGNVQGPAETIPVPPPKPLPGEIADARDCIKFMEDLGFKPLIDPSVGQGGVKWKRDGNGRPLVDHEKKRCLKLAATILWLLRNGGRE